MTEQSTISKMTIIAYISPIIALVSIAIAIMLAPSFDWVTNALSDLGHYTRPDLGGDPLLRAIVFNAGLIVTGILMFLFTIWFIQQVDDLYTKIGMIPFISAAIFLTAIGVFSENFGDIHFYVSVGLFASFPFAMWIIGIVWFRFSNLRLFCIISLILPFISVYIWFITWNGLIWWTGMAIPEIITASTAIGWIWFVNFLHHRGFLTMVASSSA